MKIGTLDIEIDTITSCLIDNSSGEEVATYVRRIEKKAELKGYTSRNGWHINWQEQFREHEIYALYAEGDGNIQGLASLRVDKEADTLIFEWAVANPLNRKKWCEENGVKKRFLGVGAHLFAIAINRSYELGYDGIIIGHPANRTLMEHYIKTLGAEEFPFSTGYRYTIVIWEDAAKKIKENYTYERK